MTKEKAKDKAKDKTRAKEKEKTQEDPQSPRPDVNELNSHTPDGDAGLTISGLLDGSMMMHGRTTHGGMMHGEMDAGDR